MTIFLPTVSRCSNVVETDFKQNIMVFVLPAVYPVRGYNFSSIIHISLVQKFTVNKISKELG